uniref:Mov34/MPN/PAD-1 family protein n=1 Tax=Herbidospora sakaeratensis TaxID=564415 RepID=UPI0007809518|nr:Mov34/MPN/PAD-1 family protein [Herbidospora sakaeratensis]
MAGNDFEIVAHRVDAPFRPRTAYAGHLRFTVDRHFSVYVAPAVAARLRRLAREAAPLETGGLLAGRAFRDDHGSYLLVTAMAAAPPVAGGHSTFHLTPEGTENLRADLAAHDPNADVTGWWHSHLAPSSYSSVDRANQSMWANPAHVGLLVFAQGSPWAALYVGPGSRGAFHSEPSDVVHDPAPPSPPPPLPPPPPPKRRHPLLVAACAVGALVLIVELLHVLAALRGGDPPPHVAWRCVVDGGGTSATCAADLGALTRPEWFVRGGKPVTAHEITFPLLPGPNVVRLRVGGERGDYDVGQTELIGR